MFDIAALMRKWYVIFLAKGRALLFSKKFSWYHPVCSWRALIFLDSAGWFSYMKKGSELMCCYFFPSPTCSCFFSFVILCRMHLGTTTSTLVITWSAIFVKIGKWFLFVCVLGVGVVDFSKRNFIVFLYDGACLIKFDLLLLLFIVILVE